MNRTLVLAGLLVTGLASIAWSQAAQQGAAATPLDPANFTGKVTTSPSSDVRVNRITFEPSARTNWHSHAGGQVILIERGTMVVQERGTSSATPGRAFKARESYVVEPNVVHWHGARPEAPLTQVAFSFGMTNWLEKVTDEQYGAVAKK
jgi:quercetin dioxygenase-like cupin family protein